MVDLATNITENLSDLTPIEIEAGEKGWVPQAEWEGDPTQWRPAKEFVDRGELMDRISSQSRQLNTFTSEVDSLKAALGELGEHNKKIAEAEYAKAMKHLKSQKAEALQYGEYDKAVDIDEQLVDLKESKKEIEEAESQQPQASSQQEVHPDVTDWMGRNSWYNEDMMMQGAADAVAKMYLGKNPAAENNPKEVLDHVSAELLKEFPDRFGGKRRRPAATTDSSNGRAGKSKSRHTMSSLTPEQRKIASTFAKSGIMTEQEYVDQLVALGEV